MRIPTFFRCFLGLLAPPTVTACEEAASSSKTTLFETQAELEDRVADGQPLQGEVVVTGTVTSMAPLEAADATGVFELIVEDTESLEVIEGVRGFTVRYFAVRGNQALRAIEQTPRGRDVGERTEIRLEVFNNPLLERFVAQDFEAEDVSIGLRGSPLLCTVELPSIEPGTTCSSGASDCCAADPLPRVLPGCEAPTEQPPE